jgi:hypothetical protein
VAQSVPPFGKTGELPACIYPVSPAELRALFAATHQQRLVTGALTEALLLAKDVGIKVALIGGPLVTADARPTHAELVVDIAPVEDVSNLPLIFVPRSDLDLKRQRDYFRSTILLFDSTLPLALTTNPAEELQRSAVSTGRRGVLRIDPQDMLAGM